VPQVADAATVLQDVADLLPVVIPAATAEAAVVVLHAADLLPPVVVIPVVAAEAVPLLHAVIPAAAVAGVVVDHVADLPLQEAIPVVAAEVAPLLHVVDLLQEAVPREAVLHAAVIPPAATVAAAKEVSPV